MKWPSIYEKILDFDPLDLGLGVFFHSPPLFYSFQNTDTSPLKLAERYERGLFCIYLKRSGGFCRSFYDTIIGLLRLPRFPRGIFFGW